MLCSLTWGLRDIDFFLNRFDPELQMESIIC